MFQLRRMSSNDLELVFKWRNSDHVRKYMYNTDLILWSEHLNWYEKTVIPHSKVKFFILEFSNTPIGIIQFIDFDEKNKKSYWGFYIGDLDNSPLLTPLIVEYIAIDVAFKKYHLNKLCCEVLVNNIKVINMHKKYGFHQEGHFKNHIVYANEYSDVFSLSIFCDHYKFAIQKIEETLKKLKNFDSIDEILDYTRAEF